MQFTIKFADNKTMIFFCFSIKFSCYFFISSATTSKRLKTPDISFTSLADVHPLTRSDRSIKASSSCSVKTNEKSCFERHFFLWLDVRTSSYYYVISDVLLQLNNRSLNIVITLILPWPEAERFRHSPLWSLEFSNSINSCTDIAVELTCTPDLNLPNFKIKMILFVQNDNKTRKKEKKKKPFWITNFSNFLLAPARSIIRWSMVSDVTKR